MSRRYDCSDPMERTRGIAEAVSALRRGELVVLPTDTVYGLAGDAFTPSAIAALNTAKGRGRDLPAPVLVGSRRAAQALIEDLGTYGQDLIDEFWPGAVTLVCQANPNLVWDLGEAKGTVALRMPLHEVALELLKESGPLAVTGAYPAEGRPARSVDEAEQYFGDQVSVYLDGGPSGFADGSTIIDLTGALPKLLRLGAISEEKIRSVTGVLLKDEPDEPADDKPVEDQLVEDQPAETEPAETEPAEAKPAEAEPVEAKPVEAELVEGKPVEAELVEAESAEAKPVEAKPVDDKPAEEAKKEAKEE